MEQPAIKFVHLHKMFSLHKETPIQDLRLGSHIGVPSPNVFV